MKQYRKIARLYACLVACGGVSCASESIGSPTPLMSAGTQGAPQAPAVAAPTSPAAASGPRAGDDPPPAALPNPAASPAGSGASGNAGDAMPAGQAAPAVDVSALAPFSFFVASERVLRELSGSDQGFGGDLRFGETGDGAGLRGADKICTTIAEASMPGSGAKTWRALLSATAGGADGGPVHAIDRVGEGPWYDRLGRIVSNSKADLMQVRPASADAAIKNDLPNEDGVPNHDPDLTGFVDNHHVLTGSDYTGRLCADDPRVTCNDWTKAEGDPNDAPRVGLSWPRGAGFDPTMPGGGGFMPPPPAPGGMPGMAGMPGAPGGRGMPAGYIQCDAGSGEGSGGGAPSNWLSALNEAGCAPGVNTVEMGPPREENPSVGSGGGYGAIYCFALMP
jgi:hypothetical protein